MELSKSHAGPSWSRLASGIEAGIVGGSAMLGLLLSESLWTGHVWWEVPNILGSTFYGARAFRSGAGLSTLAGTALHFVITGTLGGLFGLFCGGIHQRGRLVLLGVLAAVGWYNVANAMFWPRVNPWVPLASPRPATLFSHILLGACLGYMGLRQKPPEASPSGGNSEPSPMVLSEAPLTGTFEPSSTAPAAEPSMTGPSETSMQGPSGTSLTGPSGTSLTGPSGTSLTGPSGPSATPASDALE